MQQLVNKYANIEEKNPFGTNIESIPEKFSIQAIKYEDRGKTALMYVAEKRKVDAVKTLLNAGVFLES
ncbi:hypothetical protein ACFL4P_01640 [Gemmatimonadota bacterium]